MPIACLNYWHKFNQKRYTIFKGFLPLMKHAQTLQKTIIAIIAFTAVLFIGAPLLAQSVTQGYGADVVLQRGMIVGLKKDDLRKVEPINDDQFDRVHGVVVGANDSAVLLGSDNEKVYVATGGRFTVLVSDEGGDINVGDYVTVSSVSGIGMKAGELDPIIIGKAIEAFKASDSNQVIGTAQVKESGGKDRQIKMGRVLVDISSGKNPLLKTGGDNLPGMLRKASELVAGKPVSSVRVYISLAIIILCSIITGTLIYSAVRSSLIAIGRNPLSKKSIVRGLFQVVFIGLMVFLSGLFGVYLLLKL